MAELLLLSGGIDSASLAFWRRPKFSLFIDYGQPQAAGERRAVTAIAEAVGTHLTTLDVALGKLSRPAPHIGGAQERVEYRNQLLITLGAMRAAHVGANVVLIGTVKTDRERMSDGTPAFLAAANRLLAIQEARVGLEAPAMGLTSEELIGASGVPDGLLGWTISCHVSPLACGRCHGCTKRADVLAAAGRLTPSLG